MLPWWISMYKHHSLTWTSRHHLQLFSHSSYNSKYPHIFFSLSPEITRYVCIRYKSILLKRKSWYFSTEETDVFWVLGDFYFLYHLSERWTIPRTILADHTNLLRTLRLKHTIKMERDHLQCTPLSKKTIVSFVVMIVTDNDNTLPLCHAARNC